MTRLLVFALVLLLALFGASVYGADLSEREWTDVIIGEMLARGEDARWGQRTPDGSYPDIETDTHAYEVDWCRKWPEGIGQARFYARITRKKPGLILLMGSGERETIYYLRAAVACHPEIELRTRFIGSEPPVEAPKP